MELKQGTTELVETCHKDHNSAEVNQFYQLIKKSLSQ